METGAEKIKGLMMQNIYPRSSWRIKVTFFLNIMSFLPLRQSPHFTIMIPKEDRSRVL